MTMCLMNLIINNNQIFLCRKSLSSIQQINIALCILSYCNVANSVNECIWIFESTTFAALKFLQRTIIAMFGEKLLKESIAADVEKN